MWGTSDPGRGKSDNAPQTPSIPIVEVWNKWDLLSPERAGELYEAAARADQTIVPLSALTGEGCENLLDIVGHKLTEEARIYSFVIPAADGQRMAFLHARGEVVDEEDAGEGPEGPRLRLHVRLTERELGRFRALQET
jgi:GTP-binding protein HflX